MSGELIDIGQLVWEGIGEHMRRENVAEVDKRGIARGGSQGLYLNGQCVGSNCARAAHARMLGGVAPLTPEEEFKRRMKQWMFDSGHANEDAWFRNLSLSSWKGPILREEELPCLWNFRPVEGEEVKGSGREDIILCYPDGVPGGVPTLAADGREVRPAACLELKQISSFNTAAEVLFGDGKPKLEHAIQAARYMLALQCPGQIWYTNPFVIPFPNWSFVRSPEVGEAGTEFVDFSKPTKKNPQPKASKLQPGMVGYHLRWSDGRLQFARASTPWEPIAKIQWIDTIITREGLDDFWVATVDQPFAGLVARPIAVDVVGEKKWFSPCDYCDWRTTCDQHEGNYEEWRDAVLSTRVESATESK